MSGWAARARLALAAMCPLWAGAARAICANPATCGCTVSATGVAFGAYNPQINASSDSVGTVTMTCSAADSGQSTYSIALGAGSSGTMTARTLRNGGALLRYNLYQDVGRTVVWGDDSGGGASLVASFPAENQAQQHYPIYARIPPRQNVSAGIYQDVITITVLY